MKKTKFYDPRGDLYNGLLKRGINKKISFNIAIDAGIGAVNMDYINELKLSKRQKKIAHELVKDFYWGSF
jgi:hypothetical protein